MIFGFDGINTLDFLKYIYFLQKVCYNKTNRRK